jgi:UDP-N-acetylmuramate dehydrogenase
MMNMALQSTIRGQISNNEPMRKHCSWRTGGKAELYFEPADKQDLVLFLNETSKDIPLTWIGLGSNLLVRDGGVKGIVISTLGKLNKLSMLENGCVYAESGVTSAKLARFCQQHNLDGADFMAGIPGTVGGALAMNAGAFGFETWQFVESAETLNRQGEMINRLASEFEVAYRSVGLPVDEWFSAAVFNFPVKTNSIESNIKPLLAKRNASQPIGLPSCGSVFKNPKHDFAARLIEACGLKGFCIGGACVSEKHANFIINKDNASASDIEDLIEKIKEDIKQKFDIELHTEVRIIGDSL